MKQTLECGSCPSIGDFYAGRSVFITGATGFLGKAYVEKLAYQCPKIDKIYILLRDEKGLNCKQRMEKYLAQPFFMRLKQERPEAISKIMPILGDITTPNLGLKADDEHTFIKKVSVVIHCAASTKFNQLLKDAIHVNVQGTRNVLNLAKRLNNACVFVYVSTAYSNIHEKVLEEIIYPPPANLEEAKKFAIEHYIRGDDDMEVRKFIKGYPNVYNFSKALAENVVAKEHGHLPVAIIRPSIITASEREPVEGWIDNWGGTTSIVTFVAKGWIHVLPCKTNVVLDIIPLDYVVNLTVVAAARVQKKPGVTVYHSCSSSTNPVTVQNMADFIKEYNLNQNISDSLFTMMLIKTDHKALVSVATWLLQTTPAFVTDMWLRCRGKQAKYVKLQARVMQVQEALHYFLMNSWVMLGQGARSLFSSLSPEDQLAFPCCPKYIDWRQYFHTYIAGIQRYLLKNK